MLLSAQVENRRAIVGIIPVRSAARDHRAIAGLEQIALATRHTRALLTAQIFKTC